MCAQGSLAMWGSPVREEFSGSKEGEKGIPEGYKLLCGMSMGFPEKDAKINTYNPGRAEVMMAGLD